MRLLITFPGKHGDLLWALPTIRAIVRRVQRPVDLMVAAPLASIVPLLQAQPYLKTVWANPRWVTEDTAPISPRVPPSVDHEDYDEILHLGYRDWPTPDVVRHTWLTANGRWKLLHLPGEPLWESELDLQTPWITVPAGVAARPSQVVIGFTDEHFELKFGLAYLLSGDLSRRPRVISTGPRWRVEGGAVQTNWEEGARQLAVTQVFLGDCSAWHVLAVAMGIPAVIMEPNEARWNPVFYPLGTVGPQVTLVTGVDHQPTFDARHVADVLRTVIAFHAAETPK